MSPESLYSNRFPCDADTALGEPPPFVFARLSSSYQLDLYSNVISLERPVLIALPQYPSAPCHSLYCIFFVVFSILGY